MQDAPNELKEYIEAGVDLPELKEEATEEKSEEDAPKVPEPTESKEEEAQEPLQETTEQEKPKRSIYDEYKQKKQELKSERELREQAEQERDQLRDKLAAVTSAVTPEAKQEAQDELESFAREIGADAEAIKKMRDLFLKNIQPAIDEDTKRDLEDLKAWKKQNAELLERQLFDREFTKTLTTLKDYFPTASEDEMDSIKSELDKLSHTKEYHDKELDYVAWKNREHLAKLVSPKKAGIERKGKADSTEETFDFDPNADYASMTPKQREKWESEYNRLSQGGGLTKDAEGRLIMT